MTTAPPVPKNGIVATHLDPARLTPHGDRYLVELLNEDPFHPVRLADGTVKRIELPTGSEERNGFFFAKVIAKGNGHRLEVDVIVPMPFEPGDIIMVERFSGRELTLGARKYRIVNQVDCLCRVDELSPPTLPPDADFDPEQAV